MTEDISIIIPTKNRPDFLDRSLNYYAHMGFRGKILVGDSSDIKQSKETSQAVEKHKNGLNVGYRYFPDLTNYACTELLLSDVLTPYAVFLPDDDFITVSGLEAGAVFLDANPDYVCAWGATIILTLDRVGPYGRILNSQETNFATSTSYEGMTGMARLHEHESRYTSVFIGVTRTEAFRTATRHAVMISEENRRREKMGGNYHAMMMCELLTSYSLVAQGKVKALDCLYWVRQEHDARYAGSARPIWVTAIYPFWTRIFLDQLAEDLIEHDGLVENEAKEFVSALLTTFCVKMGESRAISAKGKIRLAERKLRRKLESYPILRRLVSWCRYVVDDQNKATRPFSRAALRSKSSKFHKEFAPIKEVISGPNGKQ